MISKSPICQSQRGWPVGSQVNTHDLSIDRGDGHALKRLKPPELKDRVIDAARSAPWLPQIAPLRPHPHIQEHQRDADDHQPQGRVRRGRPNAELFELAIATLNPKAFAVALPDANEAVADAHADKETPGGPPSALAGR
jgi:hypothetical protein